MGKADKIFLKIINDERLASYLDIVPSKYRSLDEGKKTINPHVRAIAEIIDMLNKKINDVKSDMKVRNKVGPVLLDEACFDTIYKKVLSFLLKK